MILLLKKCNITLTVCQEPKYTLQLYQALHPEDVGVSIEDISNVTIENILLDKMYNDCAFTVRNKLLVMDIMMSLFDVKSK